MPYIASQPDREIIDPHIEKLRQIIVEEARQHRDPMLRGMRLVRDVALNVACRAAESAVARVHAKPDLRYWIVNDLHGLFADIPSEIRRRLEIKKLPAITRAEEIFGRWWREIEAQNPASWHLVLISALYGAVNEVANLYEYDSAYVGTLNYSFTELSIHVFCDLYDDTWNETLFEFLPWFWERVGKQYYDTIGGPYEDKAIAKNGDCAAFKRALEIIHRAQTP